MKSTWYNSVLGRSLLLFLVSGALVLGLSSSGTVAAGDGRDKGKASSALPSQPISLGEGDNPEREFKELSDFYFYLDPGHGLPSRPGGDACYTTGTSGPSHLHEYEAVLDIGLELYNILGDQGAGARVFISRVTHDPICNYDRVVDNDDTRDREGGDNINWRFVSIHLNCCLTASNRVETYYSIDTTAAGIDLADKALTRIEMDVSGTGNFTDEKDVLVLNGADPEGYNILTESGHLTYGDFEDDLIGGQLVGQLAYEHYRALVDFWLIGYRGPHQNRDNDVYNNYLDRTNAGIDPGIPFDNGGGYYVHGWGDADTQEFTNGDGPFGPVYGSIVGPAAGGPSHYIPNPLWQTYIDKGGPVFTGPGLPTTEVHAWGPTDRGGQPNPRGNSFYYPWTLNFQNGAITHNDYEGTVFLPNCNAYDLPPDDPSHPEYWIRQNALGLLGRFSISNEPFENGGINSKDQEGNYVIAKRGELMQTVMFAERYAPYNPNDPDLFNDISTHWGRQWINIAAREGIIGGYNDGTFRPENPLTRGQFSKVIALARRPYWTLENPPALYFDGACANRGGYRSFHDVCKRDLDNEPNEFYAYIETVRNHNVVGGYNDGTFHPENHVTRAQMFKMVNLAVPIYGACGW
ncbi:MAG TPA: S-layer homology domain-containing protein [Chloroflexia bacterium]|nr:S-layer homology domain-containing protein [Chloroflexia bacterium]